MTAPHRSLAGKGVLVVGASAGIGRAFAVIAGNEGARLVLAARRAEKLAEVVAESGGDATPVVGDVRSEQDCHRIGTVCRESLGEIDIVLISTGFAPLKMFSDTTAQDWRDVFETNVVGVHQMICSVLPTLSRSAIVAALSSDSVRHHHPALGAYSASKAAMERCMDQWRLEHPGYRFSCVEVGGTVPTDFTSSFDPDLLSTAAAEWFRRGLIREERMTPTAVAHVLAGIFASAVDQPGVGLENLSVLSPTGPMLS